MQFIYHLYGFHGVDGFYGLWIDYISMKNKGIGSVHLVDTSMMMYLMYLYQTDGFWALDG